MVRRVLGFPSGSAGKESACNAGDLGLIRVWENPLEEGMATQSVFLPGESPWTEEPCGVHGVSKSRTRLSD